MNKTNTLADAKLRKSMPDFKITGINEYDYQNDNGKINYVIL